jgi:transposase
MATAHQIRDLIAQTKSGSVRPRLPLEVRDEETDIERLRQAALLLEHENARLFHRLETLVAELRDARGEQKNGERKEPRPGHGPRQQKALPIVEVVHELDEPDQACRSCGGHLEPMTGQFEEADEIDVVERATSSNRDKGRRQRAAMSPH